MLEIKVLGPGCPNCTKLYNLCNEVVSENNLDAQVEKIIDITEFWKYGVMLSPGLVVNEKILTQGKLPSKKTLENWLLRETMQ